jgi:hypothetical protein
VRLGVAHLFIFFEPLAGWRHLKVAATLAREVAAWEARRNSAQATMDWRFTTADARITLAHLYPVRTLPTADRTTPARHEPAA